VVAVVVPAIKPEDPKQLEGDLRAHCRQHLAPYEVPAKVEFVEKLPRSALGKLLKRDLREGPAAAEGRNDEDARPKNGHKKEVP
jgi:acyl-coenzyme A synthetase/AMP-(fatty) acid ligase